MIMHEIAQPAGGRYGDAIEIMRWMHWSWRELLEAPGDLVEEIAFRLAQESRWTAARQKLETAMAD